MNEIEFKTHAQIIAAKDRIKQKFELDLRELLLKHNAHLYADVDDGIVVAIDGTYTQHGETLTPPVDFDLGNHVG